MSAPEAQLRMTLACQRHLFDIPREVCYLNGAYMGPMPRAVREAGERALLSRAAPWEIGPESFFEPAEAARRLIGDLINASPERIALVPTAATAVATVARNLVMRPGRRIVTLAGQFPSNVYSWRRLAAAGADIEVVQAPAGPDRSRRWNERLLSSIGPGTALVAVEAAHWTDGTLFDLAAIGRRCREVDAWFLVDATQTIGIEPVDVEAIGVDALIAHPYKSLLAQYGLGFACFSDRLADGSPLEESWLMRRGSEDFSRLIDYEDAYAPGMRRYDTSTRANGSLVASLTAALELFRQWQGPSVRRYCGEVSGKIIECARSAGYGVPQDGAHAAHLFGIRPPAGADLHALRRALQARRVYVSVRGDTIRVSTHVYNDDADVERFAQVLLGPGRSG
jgi:selenocysteine lyase/cysteine desulfurase